MTKSPTQLVVGGVIGVALAVVFFSLLGWQWGLIAVALLLYEGWTIALGFLQGHFWFQRAEDPEGEK